MTLVTVTSSGHSETVKRPLLLRGEGPMVDTDHDLAYYGIGPELDLPPSYADREPEVEPEPEIPTVPNRARRTHRPAGRRSWLST